MFLIISESWKIVLPTKGKPRVLSNCKTQKKKRYVIIKSVTHEIRLCDLKVSCMSVKSTFTDAIRFLFPLFSLTIYWFDNSSICLLFRWGCTPLARMSRTMGPDWRDSSTSTHNTYQKRKTRGEKLIWKIDWVDLRISNQKVTTNNIIFVFAWTKKNETKTVLIGHEIVLQRDAGGSACDITINKV